MSIFSGGGSNFTVSVCYPCPALTLYAEALKLGVACSSRQVPGGSLKLKCRSVVCVALLGLAAHVCLAADSTPQVALETNEALFTVLAAINQCGFDTELANSSPLRQQVRDEVKAALEGKADAAESVQALCDSYTAHLQPDPSRTLAQYVSLALFLNQPPELTLKAKEADTPPDAVAVVGIIPLLQKFYAVAGLKAIWEKHREAYNALSESYHQPLSKMLFDTDIYLKVPSSSYLGRSFTVLFDPLGAPSQTNARNYGADYYVVISPGAVQSVKTAQIRHTYLHYLIDPLGLKYTGEAKRLQPLLATVRSAPLDESFKNDAALLATECFIRAVEARTAGNSKTPETERQRAVDESMTQGFVLTRFFYDQLPAFEKDPAGIRTAYGEMLSRIDVSKENKMAAQIQFAQQADPELLQLSKRADNKILMMAEQKLSSGDKDGAQKLAQQVLDDKSEDPGRALFILAEVAASSGNMDGARGYFERALEVAHEPKVVAWSHVYLARIFDLKEERDAALVHYHAALNAGSALPGVKDAAERGIQAPYEPPRPKE